MGTRITQSSSITGASPSYCFVSYPGHSLGGVLLLCRAAVSVFCNPSQLGQMTSNATNFCCIYFDFIKKPGSFVLSVSDKQENVGRCPWCNGYRRRKWTWWPEFKSWTRQIAFHITLIHLGKVWIQLFSLQLWVNSRADWFLQPW